MPYSGGSSTTTGIQYQNWFLALQFSYAFFETNFDIYPEALKVNSVIIDDIVVKSNKQDMFYNVKFRSPSKNLHWEPYSLKSQGVFRDLKKQHEANPNSKIVLVSESGCYLFSEVFRRAENAINGIDIHEALDSEFAINQWEITKDILDYDDLELLKFARKVDIKTIPLKEIIYLIKHRFIHYTQVKFIEDFLFAKAVNSSSNKTFVNKLKLNNWFETAEIKL